VVIAGRKLEERNNMCCGKWLYLQFVFFLFHFIRIKGTNLLMMWFGPGKISAAAPAALII
jgi:hypothetical protein